VLEVLVPDRVFEWFVTVRSADSGAELFSDWVDHYPVAGETNVELESDMAASVIGLLARVLDAKLRVLPAQDFLTRPTLQVKSASGWEDLFPFPSDE
jgi:hypothetical protein